VDTCRQKEKMLKVQKLETMGGHWGVISGPVVLKSGPTSGERLEKEAGAVYTWLSLQSVETACNLMGPGEQLRV
jgi:hypothetical protein